MTAAKPKWLTDQAMENWREAYQCRINAGIKQSGDDGLDMRMARRLDAEADEMLAVHGDELPVTGMGEVSAPHIAGLRAAGKGIALDTLKQSGAIPEEASIRRTDLLIQDSIDIVPMAIDAADSIEAGNSLEKMLESVDIQASQMKAAASATKEENR